ncbi:hypothetical protein [Flavobacterium phragmitis]|uniref:Uncharacterized protein n=1 Tax=Flavobacterium phragmitis TaxID=739143 RepID=A0A1I1QNW4_9FLAO|nr:hypothetical protein [Flavobacterium phragmitis]SFD20973.1 hypothetical protein SAMN05216297_105279 [Flavobacterium phragmitis]
MIQNLKTSFIISTSIIILLTIFGCLSSYPLLKELAIFFLILSVLMNLILCFIINYINNKLSIIVSVLLFIPAVLLLRTIKIHYYEFTNYENWQFYNYQPVLSKRLDLVIGKNALELEYFLCMLLLNLVSSFIGLLINYFRKSRNVVLEEEEE